MNQLFTLASLALAFLALVVGFVLHRAGDDDARRFAIFGCVFSVSGILFSLMNPDAPIFVALGNLFGLQGATP